MIAHVMPNHNIRPPQALRGFTMLELLVVSPSWVCW
ncbi:type II secretion system protein [Vogesella mureinivorans]